MPNRPRLIVPVTPNPADQAALFQMKQEFYLERVNQFSNDNRNYYSEHFADRVTRIYLELVSRGVFADDQNNECRDPTQLETMRDCAKQIHDAADKLP
jgi:hypothetical protein